MAFWKKSDDPWDRKPGKSEQAWWEQPAPEQTAPPEEEPPLTPEEQRIRDIIEGPKTTPGVPEKCPWCGGEMAAVSIYSRNGYVCWRKGAPGRWTDEDYVLQEPGLGFWDIPYKSAWYCEGCEKMTLSMKKPAPHPHDPNSFADYARQWKEREEREKEEQRRKKKER